MIITGRLMHRVIPRKKNAAFGYRTRYSMKNQETWEFANGYCWKLYEIIGWTTLIILRRFSLYLKMGYRIYISGTPFS